MYIKVLWSAIASLIAFAAFTSARPQQLSLTLVPPNRQQSFLVPSQQQQQQQQQLQQQLQLQQNNAINPSINSIGKPTNPIVVAALQREAQLPPNMLNPFYKNPQIAEILAKNSWFAPGEQHAVNRDTEKIPREKIFIILKNAGLLPSNNV